MTVSGREAEEAAEVVETAQGWCTECNGTGIASIGPEGVAHDCSNLDVHRALRALVSERTTHAETERRKLDEQIADLKSAFPDTFPGASEYAMGVAQGLRTAIFRLQNPIGHVHVEAVPAPTAQAETIDWHGAQVAPQFVPALDRLAELHGIPAASTEEQR